jgi:cell division protease FtsH
MEKKYFQFHLWYFLVVFLIILAIYSFFFEKHYTTIAYSDFKTLLNTKRITEVALLENNIIATLKPEQLEDIIPKNTIEKIRQTSGGEYRVSTVHLHDPALIQELEAAKIPFTGQIENKWLPILTWVVPIVIFIALWSFLTKRRRAASGLMEIGKSKARIYLEKQTKVTFKDVAGVDEAKEELIAVVEFLKNPKRYHRLGARLPKGVLLVGPPGTGKTLLARAVAGEAGVPFFSINGSEFVEMFAGVGAARVRDLFEQAQQSAPAIIFIDELDAVGRARGISPLAGGHDEKEQTLNQLLSEMDGFNDKQEVVLLAATNRPEILDSALLRAGRFDRQVLVDRPDKIGRKQILDVHLKKIICDKDIDSEKISALTPGFTGADLANLVNEAALLAIRHEATTVNFSDFLHAVERIIGGLEKKNRLLNENERKIVAYHEIGHILVALSLPGSDPIQKVSIIPRGIKSLGYTFQRPIEDRYLMTQNELQNKMIVLLGGRAAEYIIFNHLSTGASDDLIKATAIARAMIMQYGMNEKLGHVIYEAESSAFLSAPARMSEAHNFSDETAREIDQAVREMMKNAFDQAIAIVKKYHQELEKGAQLLLDQETLDEKDIIGLI